MSTAVLAYVNACLCQVISVILAMVGIQTDSLYLHILIWRSDPDTAHAAHTHFVLSHINPKRDIETTLITYQSLLLHFLVFPFSQGCCWHEVKPLRE